MIERRRRHKPRDRTVEQRTESVTVETETINGSVIRITYVIEATVWTSLTGASGYVLVRPEEVHALDSQAE